ncbi:MAG: uracil-DNA glycosylase [Bacteriovoracaceae bacterium]|nr:uracil-DNA glycosylase [Bacteriovoracaceae bacterium]
MDGNFKKLREDIRLFDEGDHPLSESFAGALLKETPWFAVNLDVVESGDEETGSTFESSDDSEIVHDLTEKDKTLESFYDYASSEIKETGDTIKVEGGNVAMEIKLKEETDDGEILSLDFEPGEGLEELYKSLSNCERCERDLFEKEPEVVIDSKMESPGTHGIDVLFVGDYPKRKATALEAFTSEKGDLLNKMIQAMKLENGKWHVTFSLKCHPIKDVFTGPKIIVSECSKNLYKEIFHLRPRIVVAFGVFATNLLLGREEKMSKIHGRFFNRKLVFSDGREVSFRFIPIFHPDFLLINPNMKRSAWLDLQKVMKILS